jgi:hypothetical protein
MVIHQDLLDDRDWQLYLVGGFNPSEKYLVNGKDDPIYYGK